MRRFPVPFAVMESGVDETVFDGETPARVARRLALSKAEAVARILERGWILGADTIVALGSTILGKPRDLPEARRMLRLLCGTSHQVITAVAMLHARTGEQEVREVTTTVQCADFSDARLEAHVLQAGSLDKAGGYAIQDRAQPLVKGIDGCHCNVVGLPLCEVMTLLLKVGLLSRPLALCRQPDRRLCPRLRFRAAASRTEGQG